jgi:hypothetical protein
MAGLAPMSSARHRWLASRLCRAGRPRPAMAVHRGIGAIAMHRGVVRNRGRPCQRVAGRGRPALRTARAWRSSARGIDGLPRDFVGRVALDPPVRCIAASMTHNRDASRDCKQPGQAKQDCGRSGATCPTCIAGSAFRGRAEPMAGLAPLRRAAQRTDCWLSRLDHCSDIIERLAAPRWHSAGRDALANGLAAEP